MLRFFSEIEDHQQELADACRGWGAGLTQKVIELTEIEQELERLSDRVDNRTADRLQRLYRRFVLVVAIPEWDDVVESPLASSADRADPDEYPNLNDFIRTVGIVKNKILPADRQLDSHDDVKETNRNQECKAPKQS